MAKKSQIQEFRDAARAHEADESEDRFNDTLRSLGKARRDAKTGAKPDPDKKEGAKPEH